MSTKMALLFPIKLNGSHEEAGFSFVGGPSGLYSERLIAPPDAV